MADPARLRSLIPAALCVVAASVPAASAQAAAPIGPNTYFTAQVHGLMHPAVVDVVCDVSGVGHPFGSQSVEVDNVPGPPGGYTGSAANSIGAIFPGPHPPQTNQAVVLTSFDTRVALPASLMLPCSGIGTVVFSPSPGSSTSRSTSVVVTFATIVGP